MGQSTGRDVKKARGIDENSLPARWGARCCQQGATDGLWAFRFCLCVNVPRCSLSPAPAECILAVAAGPGPGRQHTQCSFPEGPETSQR